jgi:hypothetical protein
MSFVRIDLDAPIVPNESAAGVRIGDDARNIVQHAGLTYVEDPPHRLLRYPMGSVILWVMAGCVTQIGVVLGYRGMINGRIGLGATITDVERELGAVIEDDEDNLIVPSVPGWCFETEQWHGDELQANKLARIVSIFVFRKG